MTHTVVVRLSHDVYHAASTMHCKHSRKKQSNTTQRNTQVAIVHIYCRIHVLNFHENFINSVLVTTIDAQWEGMGDVGSARYEPALLPPCSTIRVLSYSN